MPLVSLVNYTAPAVSSSSFSSTVDLSWYPSRSSSVNNLTSVLSDSGTWGFIFNSSTTPNDQYGTYNWCNMPHVRSKEYIKAPPGYDLQFVEVIHRHHKRTPYSSNAFPTEPYPWNCADVALFYTSEPISSSSSSSFPPSFSFSISPFSSPPSCPPQAAKAYLSPTHTPQNSWAVSSAGWQGTCQFPQLTAAGLDDSFTHGQDLYGVYHDLLGFLPAKNNPEWTEAVQYRVTNNKITSQVVGMVIAGMWGADTFFPNVQVPLLIEPDGIDSLEPQMPCSVGSSLFNTVKSSKNPKWANHLSLATPLYSTLDGISGVPLTDSGFHASLDHYYDNLSARQCHDKPLPCKLINGINSTQCITQDLADAVYRMGQWEYAEIYRGSAAALNASATTFGTWVATVADHLRQAVTAGVEGKNVRGKRYWHNVAHDGSMARLLGVLQLDKMVWPGMGSEVVFELFRKMDPETLVGEKGKSDSGYYVRVLFGGQVFVSANPSLGAIDMLPVETLLAYFDGLTGKGGSKVYGRCTGSIAL